MVELFRQRFAQAGTEVLRPAAQQADDVLSTENNAIEIDAPELFDFRRGILLLEKKDKKSFCALLTHNRLCANLLSIKRAMGLARKMEITT